MQDKKLLVFPDSVYYAVLNSSGDKRLFDSVFEYAQLPRCLERLQNQHRGSELSFQTLAYCCLSHEIHLLFRAAEQPLGVAAAIREAYNSWHSQLHGHIGSHFSDRIELLLVEPPAKIAQLVRHLHNLPVKRRLVSDASAYRWSSHQAYLDSQETWLDRQTALGYMANHRTNQRVRYQNYIANRETELNDAELSQGNHPEYALLGSQRFIQELEKKRQRQAQNVTIQRVKPNLSAIIDYVSQHLGVSHFVLTSQRRQRLACDARALIAWLADHECLTPITEVARELNQSPDLLGFNVKNFKSRRSEQYFQDQLDLLHEYHHQQCQAEHKPTPSDLTEALSADSAEPTTADNPENPALQPTEPAASSSSNIQFLWPTPTQSEKQPGSIGSNSGNQEPPSRPH